MRTAVAVLLVSGALAATAAAGFWIGRHADRPTGSEPNASTEPGGRRVLYWHDPMVPGQRFDKPGKSPFMDMQLEPVYADDASSNGVQVSAQSQQNFAVRLKQVEKASLGSSVDVIGTVQFNERHVSVVQTRVQAYVERLYVRVPLERVKKGQLLAQLYAPDWLGPLEELVALNRGPGTAELLDAAKTRLSALSVPESLVREALRTGVASARFSLAAPQDGLVSQVMAREGAAVAPGATLFEITDFSTVWAVADLPEAVLAHVAPGQMAVATLQADPSVSVTGKLTEILPQLDPATRTAKARFDVPNRNGALMPGMLMRLTIKGDTKDRLWLPSESVIRAGDKTLVILRNATGGFERRGVTLGINQGDRTEVVSGLAEGDSVVASGQFLIDSEANLRTALDNLAPETPQAASTGEASKPFHTIGIVESVEPGEITLSHQPVPELKWPAMTMGFSVREPITSAQFKVGARVEFEFVQVPGGYEIVKATPLQGTP